MSKRNLLICLFSIPICVVIILTNFLLLAFSQKYQTVDKERTHEILGYFRGNNNLDVNYYSNQALSHLIDVKRLINFAFVIDTILLILVFLHLAYFVKKHKRRIIKRSAVLASIITVALILLVLIANLLNFDYFFVEFHKIFFRNNLWLFPSDDNLIKLFPPEFFVSFVNQLVTNILISILALLILVYFGTKHDPKPN